MATAACSSEPLAIDQQPRLEPTTATRSDSLGRQTGEPLIGRSAGEPVIGRSAGEPTSPSGPVAPLLHVLGSVRSIELEDSRFSDASPIFSSDLATIGSLGCSATTCTPAALTSWAEGQLDVVSVATLRAAIEGPDALRTQVVALESAGITVVGFGDDIEEAGAPAIVGPPEQQIAIYAISLAPDTQSLATEDRAGVAGPASLDRLRAAVISSRNDGLGVVVLVDWGNLENRAPTDQQIDDVNRIVDAGADAIVGHGVDFLQRFDLVSQTAVAYSLGSSSIATDDPLRADTAILRLEFTTPGRSCLLPAAASPSGPVLDDPALISCS